MGTQETHDNILDCAIDMFWQQSYHGVNMNALSREIGINKATIYQHFASKEDLAMVAVKRATQRSTDYAFASTFGETDDPIERLKGIYQKAFLLQKSFYESDGKSRGCPFVSLGLEMATSSEKIREAVNDNFLNLRPFYARIIDGYRAKNPSTDPQNKEELIDAFIANMNGCLVAAKLENRPEAVLEGLKRALRILNT